MEILIPIEFDYQFIIEVRQLFINNVLLQMKLKKPKLLLITLWLQILYNKIKNISSEDVIYCSLNNIEIIEQSEYYKLCINDKINYPKSNVKLITLLKTINYGNLEFNGCPIIVNECKNIKKQLRTLYRIYKAIGSIL